MESTHFGSDAWKNHPSYDNRYPDDHPYNQKAQDIWEFNNQTEHRPKKKKTKGFQPHKSYLDDYDGNMTY